MLTNAYIRNDWWSNILAINLPSTNNSLTCKILEAYGIYNVRQNIIFIMPWRPGLISCGRHSQDLNRGVSNSQFDIMCQAAATNIIFIAQSSTGSNVLIWAVPMANFK